MRTQLGILALMLVAIPAQAQNLVYQGYAWFEPQVAIEKSGANKATTGEFFGTISMGQKLSPRFGLFLQSAHGNLWGETVFGPTLSLTPELEVGAGIGIDHYAPRLMRLRLNSYWDHQRTDSFIYTQIDFGKTGNWAWMDGARMFGAIGIGGLLQMPGGGVGPKVELRVGKVGFWVAPVYEWEEKTTRMLVGSRFMFDW